VHEIEALNQLVLLRLRENRLAEAWRIQKIAVSRQPDQARQYVLLAQVLEKMGRTGEAREELSRIDHLRALASAQNAVD
jgi:Flp pilus assembly protein TadD